MAKERFLEAAALSFSHGEAEPPEIAAVGREAMASQIVAIARRHGIPVVEEPELCGALCELPLDEQIPSSLFEAAAIVLAKIRVVGDRRRLP
jgi:type III secretion system FlhB-like substrate exporter